MKYRCIIYVPGAERDIQFFGGNLDVVKEELVMRLEKCVPGVTWEIFKRGETLVESGTK